MIDIMIGRILIGLAEYEQGELYKCEIENISSNRIISCHIKWGISAASANANDLRYSVKIVFFLLSHLEGIDIVDNFHRR